MNRRNIYISLILMMLTMSMGCSIEDKSSLAEGGAFKNESALNNEKVSLLDINEIEITTFENFGYVILVDDGFVYSKYAEGSTQDCYLVDYYRYCFSTKEHINLGTIKGWVYESAYDTIYANGHLYMFITTGSIFNQEDEQNYLYDIDLTENRMNGILLENAKGLYYSMTLVDERIYFVTPQMDECALCCYDIREGRISTIDVYEFDPEKNVGDTIRHICSDGDKIYLQRLKMDGENDAKVFMDVMNKDCELLYSIDLTENLVLDTSSPEFVNQEIRQPVSHFQVKNDILYYENFSCTRALFKFVEDGSDHKGKAKVHHIIETDSAFLKALGANNYADIDVFYEVYRNEVFVLDYQTGELRRCTFDSKNKKYTNEYITCDPEGNMLIQMSRYDINDGTLLPKTIYHVKQRELKQNGIIKIE